MGLFQSLLNLVEALLQVLAALGQSIVPWWPLIAWIAFWTFAVNWVKLREVLLARGWVGVMLLAVIMILVWGIVAPPAGGSHHLLGLNVSNFVGKLMYVTGLLVIMLLCGSVQLSGAVDRYLHFVEPMEDDHGSHGHDNHGAHESHGH
jgi:hypothetical protein